MWVYEKSNRTVDPVSVIVDPVSVAVDPISVAVDPVSVTADSVSVTADPLPDESIQREISSCIYNASVSRRADVVTKLPVEKTQTPYAP